MKIAYIAGPMTGLRDLNHPAFHAAAVFYRNQGLEVVNPAELCPDSSDSWNECMRKDIAAMMVCDSVIMLPGWEKSTGATLERHIAVKLGMTIHYHAVEHVGA